MDDGGNYDMPGGDDFEDVTNIFVKGAEEIEASELLLLQGFDLQDAMTAFEIGEPRMDNGMRTDEEQAQPPFNPILPLFPSEVCWILDRTFAAEAEWHAGNTLSQTVYTCMYMHHLEDMDDDLVPISIALKDDPERAMGLVSRILRAGVIGFVKCCDLAWRELNKGRVQDQEDWQSEKNEVSLLEGVSITRVMSLLDDAYLWTMTSPRVPATWREPLCWRLQLRKTVLHLMSLTFPLSSAEFATQLVAASDLIARIRANPVLAPTKDSPAHRAYNPRIAGKLHSVVPLRTLELPPQEAVWDTVEMMLRGWTELLHLSKSANLMTWQIVGKIRQWQSRSMCRTAYLRSMTQNLFFDNVRILQRYPVAWLADRFFREVLGVSADELARDIHLRWAGVGPITFPVLERRLSELLAGQIRSTWANGPRHRRVLMKMALDWHLLYDGFSHLAAQLRLTPSDPPYAQLIPTAVLSWRLALVQDVVLSGFQLELYSRDERPLAYWYAEQVMEAHIVCLNAILGVVPQGSRTYSEHMFQRELLTALRFMCRAMLIVLLLSQTRPPDWTQLACAFARRHKWAFRPEYARASVPVVAPPAMEDYPLACAEALKNVEEGATPMALLQEARVLLVSLAQRPTPLGFADQWTTDRVKFVTMLADTGLCADPAVLERLKEADASMLKWEPEINPWFPSIVSPERT